MWFSVTRCSCLDSCDLEEACVSFQLSQLLAKKHVISQAGWWMDGNWPRLKWKWRTDFDSCQLSNHRTLSNLLIISKIPKKKVVAQQLNWRVQINHIHKTLYSVLNFYWLNILLVNMLDKRAQVLSDHYQFININGDFSMKWNERVLGPLFHKCFRNYYSWYWF